MRIYGNVAGRNHPAEQRRHRQSEPNSRRCDGCGVVMPTEFYGKRSDGSRDNLCRECRRESWRRYKREAKRKEQTC